MKLIIIGGVSSSKIVADKLFFNNFKDIKVYGYKPKSITNKSDWVDLEKIAFEYSYDYESFIKIENCFESIKNFAPDIIFAVGISQIISPEILQLAKKGCIGFHPTKLPEGRGRAPIPWLIIDEKKEGAASFFLMQSGVDDGPILSQIIFEIEENDDAKSLSEKMIEAEKMALDSLIPKLKDLNKNSGEIQNENNATWYGKREPVDGLICWNNSTETILKIIKATTLPYPAAFTFHNNKIIKIIKAEKSILCIKGVVGRIVYTSINGKFIVQTSDGLIEIIEWKCSNWIPKVGYNLGLNLQNEVHQLKIKVNNMEKLLYDLQNKFNNYDIS